MNIAIYTLTRDRLQYTKDCFAALRWRSGHPYDHFVLDNGSEDGTQQWLHEYQELRRLEGHFTQVTCKPENLGISAASNKCIEAIFERHEQSIREPGRLIAKVDNDCYPITMNILAEFARIYSECKEAERWVLSPRVEGINKQPRRVRQHTLAGHEIGVTPIVGGLFHVVPAPIYREFMAAGGYDEKLPKASGQDDQFCEWLRANKYHKGYVEDLVVEHYRGTTKQCEEMPDYFRRKWIEEKERP